MRSDARENAFCLIFESLFHECDESLSKENLKNLNEKDQKFCDEIFNAFKDNQEQLKEKIEGKLKNFSYDRLFKIDLSLCHLALTEILFCNTPKAVALNEVLELAKKFSTEKSSKFINGLVSAVVGEDKSEK